MSDQNRFFVYEHIRNDTNSVFYVGKGTGYRATIANHHHRSKWWLRIVSKAGGFEARYVCRNVSEELAFLVEIERIDQMRRIGVETCNLTDGGDGTSGWVKSAAWREKVGRAHKGKIVSADVRKKISDSVKASGYTPSAEARAKMSAAHKGNKYTLGMKHSEETRAKMSASHKGNSYNLGKKASEETKAKMSASMTGRKQAIIECPHCGTRGGNALRRWHFDACKKAK